MSDDGIRLVVDNAEVVDDDVPLPPAFSESALALRFVAEHSGYTRYVAGWGRWLFWDGAGWKFDTVLRVFNLAHNVCRVAAAEAESMAVKQKITSSKTVAALVTLARSDPRIAATVDQWDADPWLLCTPDGTVDLQSGLSRPSLAADYSTKITAVAPDKSCPRWLDFLDRVTNGDQELQSYLKRACGYMLTGVTVEHAMFFLYGLGANGKSKFIEAVSGVVGGYHTVAQIETFTESHNDRHPTELANLRGARLVTSMETEEGRRWAESRIKSLTGGDKISARFMRQDFFEFTPTFKLTIFGNHKPGLKTVDEAIRRRMNLVPFEVTIPMVERDKNFGDKLRTEWPGILAWMIEGCLEWQRDGLRPPAAVVEATGKYLDEEDTFKSWFDECCIRDRGAFTPTAWLFNSWKQWAKRANEWEGPQRKFTQRLVSEGFTSEKSRPDGSGGNPRWGFRGIRLLGVGGEVEGGLEGREPY